MKNKKVIIKIRLYILMSFLCFIGIASSFAEEPDMDVLHQLIPLHEVKLPPGPMDWMTHHREPGQSVYEYIDSQPLQADEKRNKIYIVLLGEFDLQRTKIVEQAAEYIEAYFQLPVEFMEPLSLSIIPEQKRRVHPQTQDHQILSTYVLEDVLIPRLPDDAFNLIAFTSSDLWPGEDWNFVFGQASIEDRVGVWSIYRNGDPNKGDEERQLCLLRTVKTGTHEIGHMFGMPHCPYFECNMNGSNHRGESDRRPLWLCPVCLGKVTWNIKKDPDERYQDLIKKSQELGFDQESEFFQKSIQSIIP